MRLLCDFDSKMLKKNHDYPCYVDGSAVSKLIVIMVDFDQSETSRLIYLYDIVYTYTV